MLAHRRLGIQFPLILTLAAFSVPLLTTATAGGMPAREAALSPSGEAYEVNPDDAGNLWISDDGADEIWQINPLTGAYAVYQGLSHASDARRDAAGSVWWSDASPEAYNLGRLSPSAGTVTTWSLTATGATWGIAVDEAGRIWTTDWLEGNVFRFTPATGQLCTYPMPDGGASDYVLARSGAVWLGDYWNARILKLDPAAEAFTYWQLPDGASPLGLALTENGDLWWADQSRTELARLEPGSNLVTTFTLPAAAVPVMIALEGGKVWYTSSIGGTVGMLDPARASGVSSVVGRATVAVTPDCRNAGAGITSAVTTRKGMLSWSQTTYAKITSGGWAVYQMPDGAYPWGIATAAGQVWVIDQGRQLLARLDPSARQIYLPLAARP